MTTTAAPISHIVLDERGRPWISGTQTKVIEVALDKVAYGWDAEEMHRQHPHLSLAQLHAALAYYYDHQAELDAEMTRQAREFDHMRDAAIDSGKQLTRDQILRLAKERGIKL
jgi:uncharacterized protein (DUF433 family)